MQWYQGGIAEAVTVSRQNSSIFVVFIKGTDDKSNEFTTLIDTPVLSEVLQSNNFVAIKVDANGISHQQFSEIYKQTPIPSLYFIGKTGAPLEIITDIKDEVELINKIDNIVVKNGGTPIKRKDVVTPDVSCETDALDAKPTNIEEPKASASNAQTVENALTAEERIELAQQLIDKKREIKENEEKEKEKEKEVERRKLGQDLQKMKRWQQDQEIKQMMEDRDKERREELAARQKILDQIKQDKAERASKFQPPNELIGLVPQNIPTPQSPRPTNSARLQFKLPDGSSHMHDFQSSSTLQEVVDYVKANIILTFTKFVLSTTFPRREFTENDHSQTLADLQLCPNAVILILPTANGAVSTNNASGLMGMFWYLVEPLLNMFGYLKTFLFGGPPAPVASTSNAADNKRSAVKDNAYDEAKRPKRSAGEAAIRRQGSSNIHRLSDKDSDDENNTWNGNSTQQM